MAGAGTHPYHQQRPRAGAPRPAAISICFQLHQAVHHHHNHNRPPYDELRTISITGLPDDVRERELLNLVRLLPGYEASQLNFKGEKPMGVALFSTAQFAVAAKDKLQNLIPRFEAAARLSENEGASSSSPDLSHRFIVEAIRLEHFTYKGREVRLSSRTLGVSKS